MATAAPAIEAKLTRRPGLVGIVGFGVVLLAGVVYSGYHLLSDLATVHSGSITPYVLLGLALMVALGFEFVNGSFRAHRGWIPGGSSPSSRRSVGSDWLEYR